MTLMTNRSAHGGTSYRESEFRDEPLITLIALMFSQLVTRNSNEETADYAENTDILIRIRSQITGHRLRILVTGHGSLITDSPQPATA